MLSLELRADLLSGVYNKRTIEPLFDPVQTHAVYSVNTQEVIEVKAILKKHKATRIRIVQPFMKGIKIVCFKAPK